jgi:hypothetical protein
MEHEVGRFGIPVAVQDESTRVIGEPTKVAVVLVLPVATELHDHVHDFGTDGVDPQQA